MNTTLLTLDEEAVYEEPFLVLRYENGLLSETERNGSRHLSIQDAYPDILNDGTLILGIIPERMDPSPVIYVDDQPMPTVIGDSFISYSVNAEYLDGKDRIFVAIQDKYGTSSDSIAVSVNEYAAGNAA